MRLFKAIMKTRGALAAAAWLASLYIRLVWRTTRWSVEPAPGAAAAIAAGGPIIASLWHGRMLLMMPIKPDDRPVYVLISGHRDGQVISRGMKHLGVGTVSGSSRRGGATALREMTRILASGGIIVVTPDGPKGPRMQAKPGAIKAAQLSGASLIPLGAATTRCRILGSWDRFFLPLPFGRGVILLGEPLRVAPDAPADELERQRGLMETAMNSLTAAAERRCGLNPVMPASRPATAKAEP